MRARLVVLALATLFVLAGSAGWTVQSEALRFVISAAMALILIGGAVSLVLDIPRTIAAFEHGRRGDDASS